MSDAAKGRRRRALAAVGLVLAALLGWCGWKASRHAWNFYVAWKGMGLNREAWEAGYRERGQPVPEQGPRDGYWGARLGKHVRDPVYGWILPELHVPGLLDVDADGFQWAPPPATPGPRILLVGASTAFGGYASTIDETYFVQLARGLEARGRPAEIGVLATGAYKSEQELLAVEKKGLAKQPAIVVFLNGLNDLTNGSNAHVRFGVETETKDGSRWHLLYHEHDYPERVRVYLENMERARDELAARGVGAVFALQPALFEKQTRSPLEERVLEGSLYAFGSADDLRTSYESMRRGLAALADAPDAQDAPVVRFADCSRAFDAESATVFTDVWHFSDVGHRLLAECLAGELAPLIRPGGDP